MPSFLGWVPLVHGIGRDTGDVGLSWEPVELIIVGGGTACLPPDDLYSHLLIEIGCPEGFFFSYFAQSTLRKSNFVHLLKG